MCQNQQAVDEFSVVMFFSLGCAVAVILGKSHYILYGLVAAMQPRMLVTFDEELRPLPVSVRVGQVNVVKLQVLLFYSLLWCKA